jgi:hypothetical protein
MIKCQWISNIRYLVDQNVVFDYSFDQQHKDYNEYQILIELDYQVEYYLYQQNQCL